MKDSTNATKSSGKGTGFDKMKHSERDFRDRVKKILESKGWMVFVLVPPVRTMIKNGKTIWIPSRGQLFDLVALKNQAGIPIEVKGKDTYYPKSQRLKQKIEALTANVCFVCIRQSKKVGKMMLDVSYPHLDDRRSSAVAELARDLKEYLVGG